MGLFRGRSLRALAAGSLLFGGLTAVSLAASTALTVGTASASTVTLFSSTTAGSYSVAVPDGVTSVTITTVGGSGSAAANVVEPVPGGEGGIITSNVSVTPRELLVATVAANGSGGGGGAGNGGIGLDGGGGGGSAVFGNGNFLVVAGGGGGAAGNSSGGNADQAGGGPFGGGPGTLSGPGEGGEVGASHAFSSSGNGMDGGGGGVDDNAGGGGGYFGGGAAYFGGGGGGSSYPSASTQWDTTATPSVTITTSDTVIIPSGFYISTSSLPLVVSGSPYGPVTLQAANLGVSDSPYTTTVKWFGAELPKGLTLSSAGVLSGTPDTKLLAGSYSVAVQATETATNLSGKTYPKYVKTKSTVQATIPLIVNAVQAGGSAFTIATSSFPDATPGGLYGPVTLQAANLGVSDSPYTTTVKWFGAELPKGLTLSSAGVLSGTPNTKLLAGSYSVVVQATETVTTLNGTRAVKTQSTVQANIPLTIT